MKLGNRVIVKFDCRWKPGEVGVITKVDTGNVSFPYEVTLDSGLSQRFRACELILDRATIEAPPTYYDTTARAQVADLEAQLSKALSDVELWKKTSERLRRDLRSQLGAVRKQRDDALRERNVVRNVVVQEDKAQQEAVADLQQSRDNWRRKYEALRNALRLVNDTSIGRSY